MIARTKLLLIVSIATFMNAVLSNQGEDFVSGRERIIGIMSNPETGIATHTKKNGIYAQTRNLKEDLNIPAIAEFFGCKTVIGNVFLEETLACPLAPEAGDILRRRQTIIKMLVENNALKTIVENLLEQASAHEQEVIQLFSDFFMGKTCPELKQLALIKEQSPWVYPFLRFMHMNPSVKIGSELMSVLGTVGGGYVTSLLARASQLYWKAGVNQTAAELGLYTAYMMIATGVSSYNLYWEYSTAFKKRNKMHSLHQLIAIAEQLEELTTAFGLVPQFKASEITDITGISLIKQLKQSRYKDKNSYLFAVPFVHTFLYELYQQDKYLAEIFACIAEMDAYNALATKMMQGCASSHHFCFATFIEQEKPYIHAEEFWNVLVKDAVTNSIAEDKNILLTGPNAGGKTTTIRAILQNIMLAQTFGIAAGRSFELTPFDVIHSYLNISDDLINGLSLFASEVKRAQEIVQHIKELNGNQKFFFALDELFTGTVAEDGETCAYEFMKRIIGFDHIQFIYATHFNKLKELGNENPRCINYKVDAPHKNEEGKLVYPYTLSHGANETNVALELAREAQLFA
jgi:thymidine kinase